MGMQFNTENWFDDFFLMLLSHGRSLLYLALIFTCIHIYYWLIKAVVVLHIFIYIIDCGCCIIGNTLNRYSVLMYFDQLLLAARKVHVVYLDQLLGAAH